MINLILRILDKFFGQIRIVRLSRQGQGSRLGLVGKGKKHEAVKGSDAACCPP